jgi:hypothetical protein
LRSLLSEKDTHGEWRIGTPRSEPSVPARSNVVVVVQLEIADTEIPVVVAGLARGVGGSSQRR